MFDLEEGNRFGRFEARGTFAIKDGKNDRVRITLNVGIKGLKVKD
jgi:hypothetical protein